MYFIVGLCILVIYLVLKKNRNDSDPNGTQQNSPPGTETNQIRNQKQPVSHGEKLAIERELFRECYIGVGNPWDFTGPDGDNLIIGKLIKIVTPDCAIFQSNHSISVGGVTGNLFFLSSRYQNYDIYSSFAEINLWTCGVGIYTGSDDTYLNMHRQQLEENSKYVIIGGLHYMNSLSKHFKNK